MVSVSAAAAAILRSRADWTEVIALQDPPAPDFREKWDALRARYRVAGPPER